MTTAQDQQSRAMVPGDELHLSLLMAPHGLNLVSGQDRAHLLAYARDVWQAARALPAGMGPVGYLIDWPDEPDLGHYFSDGASTTGRSQPLHTAAQVLAMGRVPPGWQAVPMEPTAEMVRAGCDEKNASKWLHRRVPRTYGAMLAAAPLPPGAQEGKPLDRIAVLTKIDAVLCKEKNPLKAADEICAMAAQEREPLSIQRINELEAEAGLDHYELVRLVEAAHGITHPTGD